MRVCVCVCVWEGGGCSEYLVCAASLAYFVSVLLSMFRLSCGNLYMQSVVVTIVQFFKLSPDGVTRPYSVR